jgi:hypothetical protein
MFIYIHIMSYWSNIVKWWYYCLFSIDVHWWTNFRNINQEAYKLLADNQIFFFLYKKSLEIPKGGNQNISKKKKQHNGKK